MLPVGCSSGQPDYPELPDLPLLSPDEFPEATWNLLRRAYRAALDNPNDPRANGDLGDWLHAHRQYREAEACYSRARAMAPDVFRWAYYLGIIQTQRGQHEQAVASFHAAQRLNPTYPAIATRLGEALFAAGRFSESYELFGSLVRERPQMATAHYGLGRALSALGRPEDAVGPYRKACDLAPTFGSAHYALALAYRDLGEHERARELFLLHEKGRLVVPSDIDPLMEELKALNTGPLEYLAKGEALLEAEDKEGAILQFEQALRIDPEVEQARINLLITYGEMGRIEEAEQHYQTGVRINPDQAELHNNYGVFLSRIGRYSEAEDVLRLAIEIRPNYAEAHNNLGHVLEQDGRENEAVTHYRKAIENRPNYRLAHYNLGWVLLNQSQYEEAIEQFQGTLTPEDDQTPGFMYGLAAAYGRAGNRDQAFHHAQEAHRRAIAHGQTELAAMIERDLRKAKSSQ